MPSTAFLPITRSIIGARRIGIIVTGLIATIAAMPVDVMSAEFIATAGAAACGAAIGSGAEAGLIG